MKNKPKRTKRTVYGKGRRAKILEPYTISDDTWFYVDAVKCHFLKLWPLGTMQIKIPTAALRRAFATLDKARPAK